MRVKNLRFICAMIIAMIGILNNSFAQNWRLGGNPDNGGNGLLSNSNFFGATQTANLIFGTGGTPRMTILGIGSANPGFVGIGQAFTPQSYLHIDDGIFGRMFQITNTATGALANDGFLMSTLGNNIFLNNQESGVLGFAAGDLPSGNNALRMCIQGNAGATLGFVGIGAAFNAPQSLLHINGFGNNTGLLFRSDGNQAIRNQWQMFTGANAGNATEKGVLFTDPGVQTRVGVPALNHFNIQATQGDLIFNVLGDGNAAFPSANPEEVMRVTRIHTVRNFGTAQPQYSEGRVSISRWRNLQGAFSVTTPLSMLHVGENWPATAGGHRSWMEVGTFYVANSDQMYTGLKEIASDKSEAIIAFGNNPSISNIGDRMRFIFTSTAGNGTASGINGVQFAHFWTDGTNPRFGIGDFQTQGGNTDPNNTVEILPSPSSPYWGYGAGNGSSTSGLRLQRLTSGSTTVPNNFNGVNNQKLLTVDGSGDVVLTDAPVGGSGLGNICGANPNNPLTNDWEIPLNTHNFIFNGNGAGFGTNSVRIGDQYVPGAGFACTPFAKLEVHQKSGYNGSIGVLVTNQDYPDVTTSSPVYGIWSLLPSAGSPAGNNAECFKIAGRFEAYGTPCFTANNVQFALFVPQNGGTTSLGWNLNTVPFPTTAYNLQVNGPALIGGSTVPSDSQLKKNVTPIYSGLNVVRNLKPVSYQYNGKGGFGPDRTYIGVVAENVAAVAPYAIDTIYVRMDSTDTSPTAVLGVKNEAIMYTSLNAIKQLDSTVQQQQLSIDSLRNNGAGGAVQAGNGLSLNMSNVELGNELGYLDAKLTSTREIPMNGNDIYFSGDNTNGSSKNRIVIGTESGRLDRTGAKLVVQEKLSGNPLGQFSAAIVASNEDELSAGFAKSEYGIKAAANGKNFSFGINVGGAFQASNGSFNNHGIEGLAGPIDAKDLRIDAPAKYAGGVFSANPAGSDNGIGVYATAPLNDGNYAAYFDGDVYINGANSGIGYVTASDAMFKINITPITNASSLISQLQPKFFFYDTSNAYKIAFSNKKQYGLIAQEVQSILPELVGSTTKPAITDSTGNVSVAAVTYKTLNYDAFIALLIKSDQEKQVRLDRQDSIINALAAQVGSCCNNGSHSGNSRAMSSVDVELSDADAIVLNQNVPNPFAEQTAISYNIPNSVEKAQILFYDINGRMIKSVDIIKKGKGQLNVFANDLSNGIYSYTLVADGKIIETKKMVKQQ